jgi:ribosomal protein L29
MSRAARTFPSKDELRLMSVAELNAYLRRLRADLAWCKSGPVHKALVKRIGVAEKVRDIRVGQEAQGDV